MCVVSMVSDHYIDRWGQWGTGIITGTEWPPRPKTQEELDAELANLKAWIQRAKAYDTTNNEPNCELESKKKLLRELAEKLGIGKIDFI